jgi:hypothetical protein
MAKKESPRKRLHEAIISNELDMEMIPYLERLNDLVGIQSLYCCSGHGSIGYILFEAPAPEQLVQKLQIAYRMKWWPCGCLPNDYKEVGGIEIPYAIIGSFSDFEYTVNLTFNDLNELNNMINKMELLYEHGQSGVIPARV